MEQPAAKRAQLSAEEVLLELEDDDEPMFPGSDYEFEDLVCDEKRRDDEWGEEEDYSLTSAGSVDVMLTPLNPRGGDHSLPSQTQTGGSTFPYSLEAKFTPYPPRPRPEAQLSPSSLEAEFTPSPPRPRPEVQLSPYSLEAEFTPSPPTPRPEAQPSPYSLEAEFTPSPPRPRPEAQLSPYSLEAEFTPSPLRLEA